ncbi:MAG: helix-turn-helix domain-containing protein [Euzebyales bacterium]|nr:helix-turn-helix domain-containing protein [Euzebyales bacterium]
MVAADTPPGTLGTVRNAALLLDLLSEGPAHHQLTDLAQASRLSLPTVHRLLRSLMVAGLVEQDTRSSRYSLGPDLVRLSERYLARMPLLQVLGPYLVELRNRTTATVGVALLVAVDVVYVERIDGADVGGIFRRTHRSLPAHATAAGRVLLGRAGPGAWKQHEANGWPLDAADCQAWGEAGHLAAPLDELDGSVEVAVPILDALGRASAALVATGAPPAFTQARLVADVVPHLARIAERVSGTVGHA